MRLLDLFCGAGGCAMGYHRSGLFSQIVGVDNVPQPRYPFDFVLGDALEYCEKYGHLFDVIHASPPCQEYSVTKLLHNNTHPDLVEPTRELLLAIGKPYIIENVPRSALINPITLCGTMFPGLRVIRHRLFESSPLVWFPPSPCAHMAKVARLGQHPEEGEYYSVVGHFRDVKGARLAMDIDWMSRDELSQAIPPAYTEWLIKEMLK